MESNKDQLARRLFFKLTQDNEMFGAYLLPRSDGFGLDGSPPKLKQRKPSK